MTVIVQPFPDLDSATEAALRASIQRFGELDRPVLAKKLAKYPGRAPSIIGDAKGVMRMKRTPNRASVSSGEAG